MKPADALTHADRLKLETDNFPPDADVWSILIGDDHVSLHKPNGGGWIEMPPEQFRALAEWYLAEQPETAEDLPRAL